MTTTPSTHDSGTTLPATDAVTPLATVGLLALLPLAVLVLVLGVGLGAVASLAAGLLFAAVAFTAPVALPYLAVRVGTAVATRD